MEIISTILFIIVFIIILVSYNKKEIDYVSVSILGMIFCAFIVNLNYSTTFNYFLDFIGFKTILLILSIFEKI